jgi:hypothetical protein
MTEDRSSEFDRQSPDLHNKVQAWLRTEGYPLEFKTAASFRRAGFSVRQGDYTENESTDTRREIDVLAFMDADRGDHLVRVQTVVECKWSADKPWVLFCGGTGMTSAASVTQSIGSELAHLLLWKEAGSDDLARLDLFADRPGTAFGGRQAFSKSSDVVFDAVRAIVGNCRDLAEEYDAGRPPLKSGLPENVLVNFPVIVVDGRIFEARNGEETLGLREVSMSRMHWRGAQRHPFPIATLDIVRADAIDEFAAKRAKETAVLLRVMEAALSEVNRRLADGSLDHLSITRGARGMRGMPPLLRQLIAKTQPGDRNGDELRSAIPPGGPVPPSGS